MADENKALKKNGIFVKLQVFVKEIAGEFKRVIWPDRRQLINNTVTVLLTCFVIGAIIWLFDVGASAIIRAIFGTGA